MQHSMLGRIDFSILVARLPTEYHRHVHHGALMSRSGVVMHHATGADTEING
jgi:hypothetical protein